MDVLRGGVAVRACTRPTSAPAASTAILPETMPQYKESSARFATPACARLNANRQGSLLDFIEDFCNRFPGNVDDYETLLTDNRIWKQRTVGIGVVSPRSGR